MSRIQYKVKRNNSKNQAMGLFWVNIAFVATAVMLLTYYVASANRLASLNYNIQTLENHIAGLSEDNAALASQKLILDDPAFLTAFAKTRGMVQAVSPTRLLSSGGVALRPASPEL